MSAWELKIDPKRLREKISNDIEIIRKDIHDAKSIKSGKQSSKTLRHRLTRQRGSARKRKGEQFGRPSPPRVALVRAV